MLQTESKGHILIILLIGWFLSRTVLFSAWNFSCNKSFR